MDNVFYFLSKMPTRNRLDGKTKEGATSNFHYGSQITIIQCLHTMRPTISQVGATATARN
jgi:hypothetical protein